MTDDVVLQEQLEKKYDAGFTTNVEAETLPPGLDENTSLQTYSKQFCFIIEQYRIYQHLPNNDFALCNIFHKNDRVLHNPFCWNKTSIIQIKSD